MSPPSPFVADGKYKIFNVRYPTFAADLIHGNPLGTVSLHPEDGTATNHRDWKVKNLGNNQILIESIAAPNSYASSYVQLQGASLTGSPNPTIWTLCKPSLDKNCFQITTADGKYAWVPPSGHSYETIVLQPISMSQGTEAQWVFTPIA